MGMQDRYEKELLEWYREQFFLRKKYKDTPPGLHSAEQEAFAQEQLKEAEERYRESCVVRLLSHYDPPEEIFVGREEILRRVEEALAAKNGPVVLYGMGGMGKSAIAREYLRRRGGDYDNVLFLFGDEGIITVICDDYQVQVTNMQYSRDKYGNRNNYFRAKICALEQIAKEKKLLLVIDNWDRSSDKGMEEVFSLDCDILVTTRITPAAWGLAEGIRVNGFEEADEWRAFLSAYGKTACSGEEQRELEQYCRRVGGHPLLMKLKAGERAEAPVESESKERYPSDTEEAFVKFLKNLFSCYALRKEEKQVLLELSVMPVQGIPLSLYQKISGVSESALRRLDAFQLVSCSGSSEEQVLSLHPLVAETAASLFSPTLTNCRKMVSAFCDSIWNMWSSTYIENQKLEPYVFALIRAFPSPAAWMAGELEKLSTWLWIQGYYEEAKRWQKKIFDSTEKYYGGNHQMTGEMALRMAAVYYNSMDREEADRWYRRAYQVLRQCEPMDSRHKRLLATVCGKLSRNYRLAGEIDLASGYLDKAVRYFREYCDLYKRSRHPRTHELSIEIEGASFQFYRARILAVQGRYGEAERICLEAREDILSIEGEEFRINEFDTLYIELLARKGDFPAALRLAKEDLERAVFYRGPVFKDTLLCREMLGDVYLAAGAAEEAGKEYQGLFLEVCRCFPYRKDWAERVNAKILRAEMGDCRMDGLQFFPSTS
ncbi:MAG: NB-ARC domain-containing protein [Clostridiales bacterium]|nr:NB-ARC domain-containing protein [Clostridiales bacterium]